MTREEEIADNGCSMQKCPMNAFTFKSCNLSENECGYYTKQMNRFNYDADKKWIVHVPDEDDVVATDLCIIVEIHDKSRPYYSIRYVTEDGICHVGWSSYTLEYVLDYLSKFFEMKENEETNPLEDILFNDYISRRDVINQIFFSSDNTGDVVLDTKLMDRIKRIPGIQPRLKGYWIVEFGDRETGYGGCTMCSECSGEGNTEMDYCPNCGAKMETETLD